MQAAHRGRFEVTKFLVEAGASIEAKDNVSEMISIFTYISVCVCVGVGVCVWISLFFHHTV